MNASSSHHTNNRLREERIRQNWRQREVAEQIGVSVVTIKRWEKGSQQPSAYFRTKLSALFSKSDEELGLVSEELYPSISANTTTSLLEEEHFTEALHPLHKNLCQNVMALTQSWVFDDLSDIDINQFGLGYADQHRQHYRNILRVNAATRETLLSSLVMIAKPLQLLERDECDQNWVIHAIKQWLATHQGWLLILDNANDIAIIKDFLSV